MKLLNIIHATRDYLKPLVFASIVLAGLGASTTQALTTSQTFDLGTSPASTNFPSTGISSLVVWIPKGTLPTGSILRSVTATDLKLETQLNNSWASNLGVFLDPTPETPGGPDGLLKIGEDNNYGGAANEMGWGGGNFNGPANLSRTEANWAGAIDLSTVAVMFGNGYAGNTAYSGTVTIVYDVPELAAIKSFGPGAAIGDLVSNAAEILWTVPFGSNVTALSPTFTLSSGTCDKVSGGPTTYDFTDPVVYTVTDGAVVNTYTVTVTVAPDETTLLWDTFSGIWDFSTPNWKGLDSGLPTVFFNGKEVIFDKSAGGTITLVAGLEPLSTIVNSSGNYSFIGAPLAGTGELIKSGSGRLMFSGVINHTYSGGTVLNAGKLYLYDVQNNSGLGSGPLTINAGVFHLDRYNCSNNIIVDGGSIIMDNGFGNTLSGNITSNVQLEILSIYTSSQNISGTISGAGGLTLNSNFDGGLNLTGTNTYTGDTIVNGGILKVNGSAINDANKLVINGGKVQPTGTEIVGSLFFGEDPQASGTWGATGSGADHIDDEHFAGTAGVVSVGGAVTLTYSQWATTYYPAADLTDPDEDLDDDGQTNREEYAFGLNPTSGASLNPISQLPNKTSGVFKYTRTKDTGLTYTYESSTTLIAPWGSFTPVSAVSNNASPVEEITVTVPPLLLEEPSLFLRVRAQ